MKEYLTPIFLIICFIFNSSCLYQNSKSFDYISYYDRGHKLLYERGRITDGAESGLWVSYDSLGNVIKQGNYDHGCMIGNWTYKRRHNVEADSLVVWKKYANVKGRFSFSLPGTFKLLEYAPDTSFYYLIDSISKAVFSVKDFGIKNEMFMLNFFKLFETEVNNNNSNILEAKTTQFKTKYNETFYVDEFLTNFKKNGRTTSQINIYIRIRNHMLSFSIASSPADIFNLKSMLMEVFCHSFYFQQRIMYQNSELRHAIENYSHSI